jgi:hypothetical protein
MAEKAKGPPTRSGRRGRSDELDGHRQTTHIAVMPTTKISRPNHRVALRAPSARLSVPRGMEPSLARQVLSQVNRFITGDCDVTLNLTVERGKVVSVREAGPATAEERLNAAMDRAYARGNVLIAKLFDDPEMLSSDGMARRLGITRETVNAMRHDGRLLGLEGARRGIRYPAWQLDRDGRLLQIMPGLVKELGEPWAVYRFLLQRHPEFDGATGLDAARDPRREAEVLHLAGSLGFAPAA